MRKNILRHFGQTEGPFVPVALLWQRLLADAPAREHGP